MLKILKFYKAQKIKNKLFLILFTLLFSVSFLSFISIQISYSIYDSQLVSQSSVILNLFSTNIEIELKKIENMTFSILSDPKVQSYLNIIKTEGSSYEKYKATDDFIQRLMSESQNENYISSISFLDLNNNEYIVGRSAVILDDNRKKEVIERAKAKNGGIVWIEPSIDDNCIIAAREIRATGTMESLATLVVRLDPDKLIDRHLGAESKYESNILILSDNKLVFSNEKSIGLDDVKTINSNIRSYQVQTINDKKFLINYGMSSYTDWTYINILPYDNIFQGIAAMRLIMVAAFVLILLVVSFMGIKFADGITKPIIALTQKMKKAEQGDFRSSNLESISNDYTDEIGQLEHDFSIMVDKINTLINENYVKQLLIKETELKALQAQINPHFLYNTLASINGIARMNGQKQISAMVKALGNLLRSAMKNNETVITLDEELSLLNDYVTIQKIRYGARLVFGVEADDELKEYIIPKLTLQPIVENSINYGLESLTEECCINVKTIMHPEYFSIAIEDNGPGMSEETLEKFRKKILVPKGTGIGLKNIDERIKLIFGENYGLFIESNLNKGTRVNIHLPYVKRGDNNV
ncbi:MAG: sensor histidine kinase [Clostridiaceae bacterium]|nr:sensor histidine kinase [Clostridiaceae bacterium]